VLGLTCAPTFLFEVSASILCIVLWTCKVVIHVEVFAVQLWYLE